MVAAIRLELVAAIIGIRNELAKREERSRSWVAERVIRAGLTARAHQASPVNHPAPAQPAEAA